MGSPTGKTNPPSAPKPTATASTPTRPARSMPRISRGTLILWLMVFGLGFLFVPLLLIGNAVRTDTQRLNSSFDTVNQQLSVVPTPNPQLVQINTQLSDVVSQTTQISAIAPQIGSARPNWPSLMAALGNYDPSLVQIDTLTSADNRLTIGGHAASETDVINYARALEQSNQFNRVIVQSIRVQPTPVITRTATPTVTATLIGSGTISATLTPSPTPDQRDEFEVDNTVAQAKPISLGQPQLHNFFPSLDVDTETFIAKSGRYYRISTTDLAAGVDTFLSVSVGDVAYNNDDAKPGTLASEVTFQNTGADVNVIIRTTNRGQFGPAMRYQLVVEEVVPTPTPTPGPTPTPTATPTSLPDQRDAYEPDDTSPKPILIAQPQVHNFYPNGDVDQVNWLAKTGRFYRIYTTDLAAGVDTFLTVNVGSNVYTNDDAKAGTLASEVTFQVTDADVIAVARITNRGQYGPTKTYQLVMEEYVPTATPPLGPSPTPTATPTVPPDLRDIYEPDDVTPTPIAINQTQQHNFYPNGDVDQIVFNAKQNRLYVIYTSDLALGVDTAITTTLNGEFVDFKDDYSTTPGNYATAICFTAKADGPAISKIVNQQLVYGPTAVYSVTVNEVSSLPEPCAPPAPFQIIQSPSSSIGGALNLSAGGVPLSALRWLPPIAPPADRFVLQPPPTPNFWPVEFVIIVELKVAAP